MLFTVDCEQSEVMFAAGVLFASRSGLSRSTLALALAWVEDHEVQVFSCGETVAYKDVSVWKTLSPARFAANIVDVKCS